MKKLVRDLIPDLVQKNERGRCEFYIASDKEYFKELKKKLQEEVDEFFSSEDLLELADILEVVYALGKTLGIKRENLELERRKKEITKGSFDKKIILKIDYHE